MDYIELHTSTRKGDFVILVDADAGPEVTAYKWLIHTQGYPYRTVASDDKRISIPLSRAVLGLSDNDPRRVRFKTSNYLDCRRSNLEISNSQAAEWPVKPLLPDELPNSSPAEVLKALPEEPPPSSFSLTIGNLARAAASSGDKEIVSIFEQASILHLSDEQLIIEIGFPTSPQLTKAKLIKFMSQQFAFSGTVECTIKPSNKSQQRSTMAIRTDVVDEAKKQEEEHRLRDMRDQLDRANTEIDLLRSKQVRSETKISQAVIMEKRIFEQSQLSEVPTELLIRELKSRGAIKIVF